MAADSPIGRRKVRELGYRKPGTRWTYWVGFRRFLSVGHMGTVNALRLWGRGPGLWPDSTLDIGSNEGHSDIPYECLSNLLKFLFIFIHFRNNTWIHILENLNSIVKAVAPFNSPQTPNPVLMWQDHFQCIYTRNTGNLFSSWKGKVLWVFFCNMLELITILVLSSTKYIISSIFIGENFSNVQYWLLYENVV